MFALFLLLIEEINLFTLCLQSAAGTWVDDESAPEGVRWVQEDGYYKFRPHTIEAKDAGYAKFLNSLSMRDISLGGKYVPCGYGCGKFLFFSYLAQDNPDHRYYTDVFGCSHCETEAYEEEFGSEDWPVDPADTMEDREQRFAEWCDTQEAIPF